jgi:ankyrin repeat protein
MLRCAVVNSFVTGETLCHLAAKDHNISGLSFLIKNGANVRAVDNHNQTALSIACSLEDCDAAKLLVDAGADVHTMTNQGREFSCNHGAPCARCWKQTIVLW